MARTYTPKNNTSRLDQRQDTGTDHAIPGTVRRKVRISPFWQHFLEMFAAMWIGMVAGKPVFLAITGLSSTRQASQLYPAQSVLSMALSMTVPMVAWMLFRGHGWRNSAEMAAAMLVPAIPFIILCSLHVLRRNGLLRVHDAVDPGHARPHGLPPGRVLDTDALAMEQSNAITGTLNPRITEDHCGSGRPGGGIGPSGRPACPRLLSLERSGGVTRQARML